MNTNKIPMSNTKFHKATCQVLHTELNQMAQFYQLKLLFQFHEWDKTQLPKKKFSQNIH